MTKEKNKKIPGKKPWGSPISPVIATDFDNHIEERGYLKYKAIECALRIFMSLPADIQGLLMAEKGDDFFAVLTRELRSRDSQPQEARREAE
jgi:hypothetical protein